MVILSQDPSFKALAFCLYDGEDTIYIDQCSHALGDCIGFEKIYTSCQDLTRQYLEKLSVDYGVNNTMFINTIISEIPPPNGIFAPGLYALDTYLLDKLFAHNKKCREIWTLPPSFLMTVHNTRKYKKSDSTTLAKFFMTQVLHEHFVFKINKSFNADKAEALIFLLKAFVKFDVKNIKNLIVKNISGFLSDSESLLTSRKVKGGS